MRRDEHSTHELRERVEDLAARFLEHFGPDRSRPWLPDFAAWARARNLTPAETAAVRVMVLRARTYGAIRRYGERAGRRRR